MLPAQVQKLKELSQIFKQGKATSQEIQELSILLAEMKRFTCDFNEFESEDVTYISEPHSKS